MYITIEWDIFTREVDGVVKSQINSLSAYLVSILFFKQLCFQITKFF